MDLEHDLQPAVQWLLQPMFTWKLHPFMCGSCEKQLHLLMWGSCLYCAGVWPAAPLPAEELA